MTTLSPPRWKLGNFTLLQNPNDMNYTFQITKNDAVRADGTYNSSVAYASKSLTLMTNLYNSPSSLISSVPISGSINVVYNQTWLNIQNDKWSDL